nr:MAG TPA: hypothetical protein [Caudoviricetes sp.]
MLESIISAILVNIVLAFLFLGLRTRRPYWSIDTKSVPPFAN